MSNKYVVAVDGSQESAKALDFAVNLAKQTGAGITLVHVATSPTVPLGIDGWAPVDGIARGELLGRIEGDHSIGERITAAAASRANRAGVAEVSRHVLDGNVTGEIVKLVGDTNAEMLFVGSRGLSDLSGLLLGSVSHKLANLAPCSCVIVR